MHTAVQKHLAIGRRMVAEQRAEEERIAREKREAAQRHAAIAAETVIKTLPDDLQAVAKPWRYNDDTSPLYIRIDVDERHAIVHPVEISVKNNDVKAEFTPWDNWRVISWAWDPFADDVEPKLINLGTRNVNSALALALEIDVTTRDEAEQKGREMMANARKSRFDVYEHWRNAISDAAEDTIMTVIANALVDIAETLATEFTPE